MVFSGGRTVSFQQPSRDVPQVVHIYFLAAVVNFGVDTNNGNQRSPATLRHCLVVERCTQGKRVRMHA